MKSHFDHITRGDFLHQTTLSKLINDGTKDSNPRPRWKDGTPAHSFQIPHVIESYDLRSQSPFITLRPISVKSAVGEILWIYQDGSNDLNLLKDKYGVTWWDEWEVDKTRTIGSVYGHTVKRYDLMNNLLKGLKEDPFGRRHIISLWQEEEFKTPHGLKPCCYEIILTVAKEDGMMSLDMMLVQRSSDYIVAGAINTLQYVALLYMIAGHCGYFPRRFTKVIANCHLYDRHLEQARELIKRSPINFTSEKELPMFSLPYKNFYDYKLEDIQVVNYPLDKIKSKNPQLKFELAI